MKKHIPILAALLLSSPTLAADCNHCSDMKESEKQFEGVDEKTPTVERLKKLKNASAVLGASLKDAKPEDWDAIAAFFAQIAEHDLENILAQENLAALRQARKPLYEALDRLVKKKEITAKQAEEVKLSIQLVQDEADFGNG